MRYFIIILLSALTLTSCYESSDSGYETSGLRGDRYIGTLSVVGAQENVALYAEVSQSGDKVDIMMPGVSFMPGLMPCLDMALTGIERVSTNAGVSKYYLAESQMVTIYDGLPLLNDVIQSISEVNVTISESGVLSVGFRCGISTDAMGDMDVPISYVGSKK